MSSAALPTQGRDPEFEDQIDKRCLWARSYRYLWAADKIGNSGKADQQSGKKNSDLGSTQQQDVDSSGQEGLKSKQEREKRERMDGLRFNSKEVPWLLLSTIA